MNEFQGRKWPTPKQNIPIALAGILSGYIAALDRIGAPWRSAIGRAKLPDEVVANDAYFPASGLDCFLSEIGRREGLHGLGLLAAKQPDTLHMNPLCRQQMSLATSLYSALHTMTEFGYLQGSGFKIWLSPGDRGLKVSSRGVVVEATYSAAQLELTRILGICRVVQRFLGERWFPQSVECSSLLRVTDTLRAGFGGAEIRLGGNQSHFTIAWSDLAKEAPSLAVPEGATKTVGRLTDTLGAHVRALLPNYLPSVNFSQDTIAEIMLLSRRSFQRRLAMEGTSFRKLVNGVRFDRAVHLLRKSELPIAEVSQVLGYTDISNFARAFKRMSGRSPGQFRSDCHANH